MKQKLKIIKVIGCNMLLGCIKIDFLYKMINWMEKTRTTNEKISR